MQAGVGGWGYVLLELARITCETRVDELVKTTHLLTFTDNKQINRLNCLYDFPPLDEHKLQISRSNGVKWRCNLPFLSTLTFTKIGSVGPSLCLPRPSPWRHPIFCRRCIPIPPRTGAAFCNCSCRNHKDTHRYPGLDNNFFKSKRERENHKGTKPFFFFDDKRNGIETNTSNKSQ